MGVLSSWRPSSEPATIVKCCGSRYSSLTWCDRWTTGWKSGYSDISALPRHRQCLRRLAVWRAAVPNSSLRRPCFGTSLGSCVARPNAATDERQSCRAAVLGQPLGPLAASDSDRQTRDAAVLASRSLSAVLALEDQSKKDASALATVLRLRAQPCAGAKRHPLDRVERGRCYTSHRWRLSTGTLVATQARRILTAEYHPLSLGLHAFTNEGLSGLFGRTTDELDCDQADTQSPLYPSHAL